MKELPQNILEFKLGAESYFKRTCPWCQAYKFPTDQDGQCCNKGKVELKFRDPPKELQDLVKNDKGYRDNCRNFNNALAFASTGLKEVFPPGNSHFVPNVRIHGKVYHAIDSLYPDEGERKKFAQIYINDGEE